MRLGLLRLLSKPRRRQPRARQYGSAAAGQRYSFSQNCGGLSEDAGAVWPRLRGAPYLRSHADPYCVKRDMAAWHTEVPLAKFADIAKAEGWETPANIVMARVTKRSASHRASAHSLYRRRRCDRGRLGKCATLWDWTRAGLGSRSQRCVRDWRAQRSIWCSTAAGMDMEWGCARRARRRWPARGRMRVRFLRSTFPGTAVRIAPGDDGWQETRVGSLTLRATQTLTAGRKTMLERTWNEAQKRFPPRHPIEPEIVFAPTTEVFRQLTAEPGWALASTQGSAIVLQPDAVLVAHGRDDAATLLHEMLHVLVEAETSERTPLWLREGLVEVLGGRARLAAPTALRQCPRARSTAGYWHANSLQAASEHTAPPPCACRR